MFAAERKKLIEKAAAQASTERGVTQAIETIADEDSNATASLGFRAGFDKRFAVAFAETHSFTEAFRRAAGYEAPTAAEVKAIRQRERLPTIEEMMAEGYHLPESKREAVLATLTYDALNAPTPNARATSASLLAKMMPGWIAPTESKNLNLTGSFAELVKQMAGRNHEPGEAERIVERT
jgi:hypothetical protein